MGSETPGDWMVILSTRQKPTLLIFPRNKILRVSDVCLSYGGDGLDLILGPPFGVIVTPNVCTAEPVYRLQTHWKFSIVRG